MSALAKDQLWAMGLPMQRIVLRHIRTVANGYWSRKSGAKRIEGVPPSLKLYETKLTKGARMLWEQSVGFSTQIHKYTDIIRVWAIEKDHDKGMLHPHPSMSA